MRVVVQGFTSRLYGKDCRKFPVIDPEYLRESLPCGLEEDGVEGAVVLEEDPEPLRNGKDGVTMGNVFDDFVVDMSPRTMCGEPYYGRNLEFP